jgi:hypothetical protein
MGTRLALLHTLGEGLASDDITQISDNWQGTLFIMRTETSCQVNK